MKPSPSPFCFAIDATKRAVLPLVHVGSVVHVAHSDITVCDSTEYYVDLFVSGALSSVGKGCGVLESGVCHPSRLAYVVEKLPTVATFKIARVLLKKHTPVVNTICEIPALEYQ